MENESTINVSVSRCNADSNQVNCPRCQRWHFDINNTKWSVDNHKYADRHVICTRCEDVLIEDWPNEEATALILQDRNKKVEEWNQKTKQLFS